MSAERPPALRQGAQERAADIRCPPTIPAQVEDEPVVCECLAGRQLVCGDAHDDARQAEAKSLERRSLPPAPTAMSARAMSAAMSATFR